MVQAGDGPGLTLEALAQVRALGEVIGQYLDCDRAVEARVFGPVHLAHAPGPERRHDLVGAQAPAGREAHGFVRQFTSTRKGSASTSWVGTAIRKRWPSA